MSIRAVGVGIILLVLGGVIVYIVATTTSSNNSGGSQTGASATASASALSSGGGTTSTSTTGGGGGGGVDPEDEEEEANGKIGGNAGNAFNSNTQQQVAEECTAAEYRRASDMSCQPAYIEGIDFPGYDIVVNGSKGTPASSVEECAKRCADEPACALYQFHNGKTCYMKTASGLDKYGPSSHSKLKGVPHKLSNTDLKGWDLGGGQQLSAEECESGCNDNPRCDAYTFVEGKGCWHKQLKALNGGVLGVPEAVTYNSAAVDAVTEPEPAPAPAPAPEPAPSPVSSLFDKYANRAISGHNDRRLSGKTLNQCLETCAADPKCQGVDWHRGQNKCDLSFTHYTNTGLKADYPGNPYDHYAKTQWGR